MDKKLACPASSILLDLIQGKKVEPELSELATHLEQCPECQAKVKTLSPYDTLSESLRGPAPKEDKIADNVPRPLIEKLKQIPRSDSVGSSGTIGLSAGSVASPAEQGLDFLAPAQQANEIGRLGHYRVLKVLGKGGMGAVFLAEDPKLERQVALKVMLPNIAANPTAKDRFLREAKAAAKLKSDHIVTIHQVDEANGVPYLAMELLEGQSLDDFLRAGNRPDMSEILDMARDIARGLATAHEKGLIHRDIKPGNLSVETSAASGLALEVPSANARPRAATRIKILDFGLARAEQDAHITQTGAIVGTPAFMAPEQARGDKSVDARADLFSLGCVLYRLCVGDIPFKAETTIGTLMAVAMNEPLAPGKLNNDIPLQLSELIMQLLEKDPVRRPKSAREVIARLNEIERSLSGSAAFPLPAPRAPGAASDSMAVSDVAPEPITPSRKRRPVALAFVGMLFAALIVLPGAIFFWQTPDGRVVRIECDDPAIKIAFEDGEFKVTGAYKDPITLKPGKVGLKIKKGDDFEFETDKLVVNKGDKIVLRIEVVQGKVQIVQADKGVLDEKLLPVKPGPIAVADADRKAGTDPHKQAELARLLVENQKLKPAMVIEQDGKTFHVKAGKFPDGPFRVKSLSLYPPEEGKMEEADVPRLAAFTDLEELGWGKYVVTDAGLESLLPLQNLRRIELHGAKLTLPRAAETLRKFPKLEHVMCPHDKGWVEALAGIPTIRSLHFYRTRLSAEALNAFKDYPNLAELSLDGCNIADGEMENLSKVKSLRLLTLWHMDKPPGSLERAKALAEAMPWCEIRLGIGGTKFTVFNEGKAKHLPAREPMIDAPEPPAAALSIADILTSPDYEWTEPKDLGIELLAGRAHSVTADGLELWFARGEESKGEGRADLWVCRRKSLDAPWEAPVNVGPPINTVATESQPVLSADGLTLLFHVHGGGFHVMESNRTDRDAPWSKPVSITGPGDMRTTALSADGLEAYSTDSDGTLFRYTRPNRKAKWIRVGVVEDGPGRPVWFSPDGRWCFVCTVGDGKDGMWGNALWLAQRPAPGQPWGEPKSFDLPPSLKGMRNPYPLLTPEGLAIYFVQGNKLHVAHSIPKARAAEHRAAEWALSLGGSVIINGRGIKEAAELPDGTVDLSAVNFKGVKRVIDADLANLKGLTKLATLNLNGTSVTDAGLAYLSAMPGLQRLDLGQTKVTAKGLADFHAAVPGCRIEHDGGVIERKNADPDRRAAEWVLSLDGTISVNDERKGIKAVAELPEGRFTVTRVDLRQRGPLADMDVAQLKDLKELKSLAIGGTSLTDAGLAHLRGHEKLTYLALGSSRVTDAGLAHLKGFPALKNLFLTRLRITDAGLAHLAALSQLSELNLAETQVTDAGLAHLHKLTGLQKLDVRKTKVTAKGLEDFHVAVPGCKIEHDGGVIEAKK